MGGSNGKRLKNAALWAESETGIHVKVIYGGNTLRRRMKEMGQGRDRRLSKEVLLAGDQPQPVPPGWEHELVLPGSKWPCVPPCHSATGCGLSTCWR